MKKSKIFIIYDSRNIEFEDSIPHDRFIKNSIKHNSKYIKILVENNIDNSLILQVIVKKYKPELFNILKEIVLHGDYRLHVTKEYVSDISPENFVYTKLICEFEPGFSPWIQAVEEINTYNDLYNII